jgi:hypothetical protein
MAVFATAPLVPILRQISPVLTLLYFFKISFNIILPYSLYLTSDLHSSFTTKNLYAPFFFPVCTTRPIYFVLYLITEYYLLRSTDYEAPHYKIFSSPLLLPPFYVQLT